MLPEPPLNYFVNEEENHSPTSNTSVSGQSDPIDYANQFSLHETLDMLVFQVSLAKPKNPAAYMAYLLRERLRDREGIPEETPPSAPVIETKTLEVPKNDSSPLERTPLEKINKEEASATTYTPSGFRRFGIWIQVQSSDVPRIVEHFHEICRENNLDPPRDFTDDTPTLLRTLSKASAEFFFKGFSSCREMIPLRPHKDAPSACLYLMQAVTDIVTFATFSQRRSLATFFESLMDDLRMDDINEMRTTTRTWKSFRDDPSMSDNMWSMLKQFTRQLDYSKEISVDVMKVYLGWIDTVVEHQDMSALERREMMANSWKGTTSLPHLPDRFVVFCGFLLAALHELYDGTDRVLKEKSIVNIQKLILTILEDENAVTMDSLPLHVEREGFPMRLRRGDPPLVTAISRIVNNIFSKKFSEKHGSAMIHFSRYLQEKGCKNECCAAFLEAAKVLLDKPLSVSTEDSLSMRCSAAARLHLLQSFVDILEDREDLMLGEVELRLLRSRLYGTSAGTFSVYFCDSFLQSNLPDSVVDHCKFLLGVMHEVCVSVNKSPLFSEFRSTFRMLADVCDSSDAFSDTFTTVPPIFNLSPQLFLRFLNLKGIFIALSNTFDAQTVNAEELYFDTCLLIATRMLVARLQITSSFNFVAMGILSGLQHVSEKVAMHTLLPACEVMVGLSRSLHLPVHPRMSKADILTLNCFFCNHPTSNTVVSAIHQLLEWMPELRPRAVRTSISYERVEQRFYSDVLQLLHPEQQHCADILKLAGMDLGFYGVTASDLDLFILALTCSLRGPDFPEAVWNVFVSHLLEQLKSYLPVLPPLTRFKEKTKDIIRIQRTARKFIRLKTVGIRPKDKALLNRLLEELSVESTEKLDSSVSMGTVEAQLVFLTWRLQDKVAQTYAVYRGVETVLKSRVPSKKPSPVSSGSNPTAQNMQLGGKDLLSLGSSRSLDRYQTQQLERDETKETFAKCKRIAEKLSDFIKMVCDENGGKNFCKVWENNFSRDFESFFENLFIAKDFMQFAVAFIEIIRVGSVTQHSSIRVVWATFIRCFDRMVNDEEKGTLL